MSVRVLVGLVTLSLVPFMSVDAHHQDRPDAVGDTQVVVQWSVAAQGGTAVIDTGLDEAGKCRSLRGSISGDVNSSGDWALGFERVPDQSCRFRVHASEVEDDGTRAAWRMHR